MNLKRKLFRGLLTLGLLSIVSFALTVTVFEPYFERLDAQNQFQQVPITGSTLGNMAFTGTTTVSNSIITLLKAGGDGTKGLAGAGLFGSHGFYGYRADGTAPCYIQVFDGFPASALTLGTTVPIAQFVVNGNSSLGLQSFPLPMFTIDSSLAIAATATPYGSGACSTSPVVAFQYNKN